MVLPLAVDNNSHDDENAIRSKICSEEFLDNEALDSHWMDIHKKDNCCSEVMLVPSALIPLLIYKSWKPMCKSDTLWN